MNVYLPRVFFKMIPSKDAEPCILQLGVSGMSQEIDFHILLRTMTVKTGRRLNNF